MLAGIKKRLTRKQLDLKEIDLDDDKDDLFKFRQAANFIKISQGKIQLVHQNITPSSSTKKSTSFNNKNNNRSNKISSVNSVVNKIIQAPIAATATATARATSTSTATATSTAMAILPKKYMQLLKESPTISTTATAIPNATITTSASRMQILPSSPTIAKSEIVGVTASATITTTTSSSYPLVLNCNNSCRNTGLITASSKASANAATFTNALRPTKFVDNENCAEKLLHNDKKKDTFECRLIELEDAVLRLQEKVNSNISQCSSPTFEKELRQQLESLRHLVKSKERKQLQTCRDHKVLQIRFSRQKNLLHALKQENKALLLRIHQYEHCLDDVMRKVVDALVAEDTLREEVMILKNRVRDLEVQNNALNTKSPIKSRDEGYCTMSSNQLQPSNSHLEDLPEEPEQWLLPVESYSTEMEDWSMSQEELAVTTLDEEYDLQLKKQQQQHRQLHQQQGQEKEQGQLKQATIRKLCSRSSEHDWIWNSNDLLNLAIVETDFTNDNISHLLQQKVIYSEDEETACTEFTNDFYKLVNIRSNSVHSLHSYVEGDSDGEDDDDDEGGGTNDDNNIYDNDKDLNNCNDLMPNCTALRSKTLISPTFDEASLAPFTRCLSSETDDTSQHTIASAADIILQHQQQQQHKNLLFNSALQSLGSENCQHFEKQLFDVKIENIERHDNDHYRDQFYHSTSKKLEKEKENGDSSSSFSSLFSPVVKNSSIKFHHQLNEEECIEQIIRSEFNRIPKQKLTKSQSAIESSIQQLQRKQQNNTKQKQQRRKHIKSNVNNQVIRSGSVNEDFLTNYNKITHRSTIWNANARRVGTTATPTTTTTTTTTTVAVAPKINSWRRCNGWKRLDSPSQSPSLHLVSCNKKPNQYKTTNESLLKSSSKVPPTRIPSSNKINANNVTSTVPILSSHITHRPHSEKHNAPFSISIQNTTATSVFTTSSTRKSKIPPAIPVRRSCAT